MSNKTFTAYKLRFTTPLHIGDNRDDYGISLKSLSSDSFYSAIIATLAKMGKSIPKDGELGCVISALFPYYQKSSDSDTVYFFPCPLSLERPSLDEKNYSSAKKLKVVKWLDLSHFQRAIKHEDIFAGQSEMDSVKGDFLTKDCVASGFIVSEVSAQVAVSRNFEEDARPFYMDRLYFKDHSGLFFLLDGESEQVDEAISFLSLEGVGTDRNVGNGFFEYEKTNLTVECPDHSEYGISLSSLIPSSQEQLRSMLDGENVCYELMRRGGWITTPPYQTFRKNAIYAFAPGSVFKGIGSGDGKIVDLAPAGLVDHHVWRCGKALVLPINV